MSTRPLRVLHVLGSMGFGGVETWLMHVLRQIDRSAFQMDFCHTAADPGAYAPEIQSLGGEMVPCPLARNSPFEFGGRFRSILADRHYDIVHSHVHHFSGYVVRLASRERVRSRIAHCHSVADGKTSSLPRALYRRVMKHWVQEYSTLGLGASQDCATALFGEDWREDPRFRVLHYGIDLGKFRPRVDPGPVRKELGIPEGAPVVGHAGRFVAAKNHRYLLEVSRELIRLRPDVRVLLVGDGPLRLEAQSYANQLGIDRSVIFTGARSDVPRLMLGAMDVFLFPSKWEGLPVALLEAQAAGLCCVASDTIPAEALALPAQVVSLPLSLPAKRWAEAISQALEKERMGLAEALEHFEKTDFSVEKSCQSLADLYARTRNSADSLRPQSS